MHNAAPKRQTHAALAVSCHGDDLPSEESATTEEAAQVCCVCQEASVTGCLGVIWNFEHPDGKA